MDEEYAAQLVDEVRKFNENLEKINETLECFRQTVMHSE